MQTKYGNITKLHRCLSERYINNLKATTGILSAVTLSASIHSQGIMWIYAHSVLAVRAKKKDKNKHLDTKFRRKKHIPQRAEIWPHMPCFKSALLLQLTGNKT